MLFLCLVPEFMQRPGVEELAQLTLAPFQLAEDWQEKKWTFCSKQAGKTLVGVIASDNSFMIGYMHHVYIQMYA